MDIIVTLKQVPDPEAPKETFRIDESEKKILNPPNIDPVINGYDENAIEAALQLKDKGGRQGGRRVDGRSRRHPRAQAGNGDGCGRGHPVAG